MMKKTLSFLLALLILLCSSACGSQPEVIPSEQDSSITAEASSVQLGSIEEADAPSADNVVDAIDSADAVDSVMQTASIQSTHSVALTSSAHSAHQTESIASASTAESVHDTPSVSQAESAASVASITDMYGHYVSSREPLSELISTVSQGSISSGTAAVSSPTLPRTDTAQQFIEWVKTTTEVTNRTQVFFQRTDAARKILIPYSTRSDLEVFPYLPTFYESGTVAWDFYTYVSKNLVENERYSIHVKLLTNDERKDDLRDYFYPNETDKMLGTYNGITYAYFNGYEGEDWASSAETAAWFVLDDFLIQIKALYINDYKPWSNEWFDYFGFEIVTL